MDEEGLRHGESAPLLSSPPLPFHSCPLWWFADEQREDEMESKRPASSFPYSPPHFVVFTLSEETDWTRKKAPLV